MTIDEYIPRYNLFHLVDCSIYNEGKHIPVVELFANFPNQKISELVLFDLDLFDLFGLQKALQDSYWNETNIIPFLRSKLDDYRTNGGDPLDWLYFTMRSVHNNPENYSVALITTIEKSLVGWINHFESLPQFIKDTDVLINRPDSNNLPESQVFLECLKDAIIDPSHYEMIIGKLHENGYCTPKGSWKDHKAGWKTTVASLIKWLAVAGYCRKRKFSTNEIRTIAKNTFNISDNIESTIKHAPSDPAAFKSLFPEVEE